MDAAERARTYATLADSTRRWVSVMDTKAGFMFAVNGALLTFMWTAARLGEVLALARWLAIGASLCSLLALLAALWIIIPRAAIGRRAASSDGRPVSFYGYVATAYAAGDFQHFERDLAKLDDADFAREALQEHFTVSRIVEAKATWVSVSGVLTLASMALAGLALLVKTMLG
jgi:pycsar effector protein